MKKKLQIVKIGGNVIDDENNLDDFLSQYSKITDSKILIHGGGKLANDLAKKLGVSQAMVNGRRITDAETLKLVVMVYAGLVNKTIVAKLQAKKQNAIGLSGADLNMIHAHRREKTEIDYGFVGDIDAINTDTITALVESDINIVFCPITHDTNGQLLNTNADTIASAIAIALSKKYEVVLTYCFEKNGVLKNIENKESAYETLSKSAYKKLTANGTISKGMIPKLDNAFNAIGNGVEKVIIGNAKNLDAIVNQEKNNGTVLTK